MELRPYQLEAISAIRARFAAKDRATLLVLPTGCGKTVVFAEIARRTAEKGRRTLVLAHREELISQAAGKLRAVAPDVLVDIEMAEARAGAMASVVVASVQSLARDTRLARWARDHFALVVIDEAHRAPSPSYRKILAYFDKALVLGVTATPDRQDRMALAAVFDSVAYTYEIRDAIAAGYLAPIRQYRAQLEGLDLGDVHTRGGDLDDAELEAIVGSEAIVARIAQTIAERSGDRPTVVFTPRVASAHALAEALVKLGIPAAGLDGTVDRDERKRVLARFERGDIRVLTNCSLFTEGWDCPKVACVVMARPTKSRALYAQAVGRGTRLAPGKTDLLVLDICGNAGRHRLVNPIDILGGDKLSERVKKRAQELIDEDETLTTEDAIAAAEAEANDARRQHQERFEKARMRFEEIDPFALLDLDLERAAEEDASADPSALPVLLEDLQKRFKLKDRDVRSLSIGQARELARQLEHRKRSGLCTFNQARFLARQGLNPEVSFADASAAMAAAAANRWRVPESLRADPRFARPEAA